MKRARTLDRWDALGATWIGVLYAALLLRTTRSVGYARDEGFYFQAATSYARWFELLWKDHAAATTPRAIDAAWTVNHEHPSLMKSLFALSNLILEQRFHLFAEEGTSYRFPAIVIAALGVALVYLWGAEARSRVAGAASAVALAAMPAFFFHAHLACFDAPIVTMWLLSAYAYWKSLRKGGVVAPILAGLAFGLALDTKHNAWFLPIATVAHAITWLGLTWLLEPESLAARFKRAFTTLASMAILGPTVLIALWPWLWHGATARLVEWTKFHLNHEYYNMEFLGENYWKAPMPRGYAWLMTIATVPAVTLALFALGLFLRTSPIARALVAKARERAFDFHLDEGGTDLLWLVCLGINYAAWLSPKTPIFGGTKHWLTAYPFLVLFAGAGFERIVVAARRWLIDLRKRVSLARTLALSPWITASALGLVVALPPIVETAHAHPWGLASYTPLVGGNPGAASLGLNRTFWGYATGATTEYLDALPQGTPVFLHDTVGASWDMLQRDGRLRRDLRGNNALVQSQAALFQHELHMRGFEYAIWSAYGTDRPSFVGGLDGVPVIQVYKRP